MPNPVRRPAIQWAITAALAAGALALGAFEGGFGATAFSATALVVWSAVLIGLAAGLVPRAEPPRGAIVAGGCLAGLTAMVALSVTWASDNGRGFEDAVRALGYLGLFALVVLVSRRGGGPAWLRALALALVGIAGVSLLARFEPSLALPFADTDIEIGRDLPAAIGRLSHPIGYWNGLAAAMALCVVLLGWLGAHAPGRLGRSLAVAALPLPILALFVSASLGGAIATGVGLAVLVIAGPSRLRILGGLAIGGSAGLALLAFADARTGFLDRPGTVAAEAQGQEMLALTLFAVAAALAARHVLDPWLGRARVSATVARAAVAGAAVLLVAGAVAVDLPERYDEFKQPPTGSEGFGASERDLLARGGSNGRWQFWGAAVDAFESQPVRGIGAGGYEAWWTREGSLGVDARNAHSLFLDTLSETGAIGALAVLGFFGVSAAVGTTRLLALRGGPGPAGRVATTAAGGAALAMLAAGLTSATADWTWDLPAVFGPVIVAAALLTGPATLAATPEVRTTDLGPAGSRRRFAGGVGLLLTAWIAICASALLLLANHAIEASQDAAGRGDLEAAAGSANDAIDLEPWAAEPRSQLALVLEQAGDLAGARRQIDEAIERAPEDWRLWVIAIRLDLGLEDIDGALAGFERVRALNPRDPTVNRNAERYLEGLRRAAAT